MCCDAARTQTRDWLSLSFAPGIGPAGFWRLVKYFGSPAAVLGAAPAELRRVPGLRARQADALAHSERLVDDAEREMDRLRSCGAEVVIFTDLLYPELLRQIACPPPVLYVRGRRELLKSEGVAVIGSRAATSYGQRTAFGLGRDLGRRRIPVVSGLALGIDAEAHAGCLAAGGDTIAVLGCGLDVVYPRTNAQLYARIGVRGLLVTEYPLGTKPEGFRFPARNRIIAGLSCGVVVVEASRKSGSLITVQHALESGREVCAVPGQIDSVKSSGAHWLLQQGASLVVSADDIVEQLRVQPKCAVGKVDTADISVELDCACTDLLALLDPYPVGRDELLVRSGLSAARLSELLLLLELAGRIERLPGDRVRKLAAS